jgi:NTP pyrophosphatase (non-canonical NTP hydrolase)
MSTTLDQLQARVEAHIGQFQEGYFPVFENLGRLSEEVGELAREVSHLYGLKKKKTSEEAGSAQNELGDILFVLACLANQMGLSLEEALGQTFEKYNVRDAGRWTAKTAPDQTNQ